MASNTALAQQLESDFAAFAAQVTMACDEVTLVIPANRLRQVCLKLRDDPIYHFDILIDVCGVDYLHYGQAEWETDQATRYGFDRGVRRLSDHEPNPASVTNDDQQTAEKRFAVVYHLLSVKHNHRLRLRTFAPDTPPMVDSMHDVWASANWFEREAFDLYGILFNGHTDLRRLLTDYGFIGHPFRKDFPLSGHVEVRYDKTQQRVVYEPVDIEPRVLVPKIIRDDSRYLTEEEQSEDNNA